MEEDSDPFVKCLRCNHQKIDHDKNVKIDKMRCLIENCNCKKFKPDRKYYRSSKKWTSNWPLLIFKYLKIETQ